MQRGKIIAGLPPAGNTGLGFLPFGFDGSMKQALYSSAQPLTSSLSKT